MLKNSSSETKLFPYNHTSTDILLADLITVPRQSDFTEINNFQVFQCLMPAKIKVIDFCVKWHMSGTAETSRNLFFPMVVAGVIDYILRSAFFKQW